MHCYVPDGAFLYRHALRPTSFKGKNFSSQKALSLYEESAAFETSVAWDRLVPTEQHVHDYGCRMAGQRNDKARRDGKYKEANKQVYCGAYRFSAGAVRAMRGNNGLEGLISASVKHQIENGEIAHTAVKFVISGDHPDREGLKTAIIDRLWNLCSGPMRHVCTTDADLASHPSTLLGDAPLGNIIDGRTLLQRSLAVWHLDTYVRFLLLLKQLGFSVGL